jgi:acyl-CoA synthetase (AMP-forming)/AMP-acid ligase II
VIHDADATALSRGIIGFAEFRAEVRSAEARHHHLLRATPIAGATTRPLVSSGPVSFDTRVVIADPDTHLRCPDGRVGEIWVASPSVARGYWRRPAESRETFNAHLAGGEGPFLRTGDLGAVCDGELFVTGRLKDVLIVRGLKHYPQDLEHTAERQHVAIRAGCTAAFSVDSGEGEAVVLAMELDPRQLPGQAPHRQRCLDEIIIRVRQAVAQHHGIVLEAVSLLSIGALPKTSSGKLRRRACRTAFLDGSLGEIVRWVHTDRDETIDVAQPKLSLHHGRVPGRDDAELKTGT